MTTKEAPPSSVYLGLTDVPQPLVCPHLGIQHSGEVIVADRWRKEWGAPLQGDAYHREYHRKRVGLTARLEDATLQLAALGHLNSILALGEPVGRELDELYQLLKETVKLCTAILEDLSLDLKPLCSSCALILGEELPSQEAELFFNGLERSLQEQNRRLIRVLVDRILHGQSNQRLENFLKIVQASDLSALANALDEEMVHFIRRLVSSP